MTTFWIALAIVALAYAARSSIRTLRNQIAADPRAGLLLLIGAVFVARGLWR